MAWERSAATQCPIRRQGRTRGLPGSPQSWKGSPSPASWRRRRRDVEQRPNGFDEHTLKDGILEGPTNLDDPVGRDRADLLTQQYARCEDSRHVRHGDLRWVARRRTRRGYRADGRQLSFLVQAIVRDNHRGANPRLLMANGRAEIHIHDVPSAGGPRTPVTLVVGQRAAIRVSRHLHRGP